MATSRRMRLTVTVLVLVAAATAGTVTAAVSTGEHRPAAAESGAAAPAAVDVNLVDCGSEWAPTAAGEQVITVHNADFRPGEIRVVGVGPGIARQVFAQIEPFAPGSTVAMHVRLAAGQYALQCLFEEQSPVTGPARTISGDAPGVRGVVPIPQDQLIRATLRYTRLVRSRLPQLEQQTRALARAIGSGNLGEARRQWLLAHAGYERLGAAYEAFGELDGVINGLPSGLPKGVRDPDFTGFHRVELGLWGSGSGRAELRHQADVLVDAVGDLRTELANSQLAPLTFTIRAHEIAENLLRPVLTGRTDFGSHSDLATVAAGLAGTRAVLDQVRKPLRIRYPHLHALFGALAKARHLVDRLARDRLGHTAIADWPQAQRQRVDAAVADLAERLAPVATVLEPRRIT